MPDHEPPPYDPVHEDQVLGAVLSEPWRLAEVVRALPEQAFRGSVQRAVYSAMRRAFREAGQLDRDQLVIDLRAGLNGRGSQVEGYLWRVRHEVGSAAYLERHVRWLRAAHVLEQTRALASEIPRMLESATPEADETVSASVSDLQRRVSQLSQGIEPEKGAMLADAMEELVEQALRVDGPKTYRSTGIGAIDRYAMLYEGEFYVLGARTSSGKTAIAVEYARNVAAQGAPVIFFSCETKALGIALRALAREAMIDSRIIRSGGLGDAYADRLHRAVERQRQAAPIDVQDGRRLTPERVRAHVIRRTHEWGCKPGLIVVDYLQRMHVDIGPRASRAEKVAEASSRLQELAYENGSTVLATAQLNRDAERETPGLHHLKDCGDIEQDADVVGLMHTDDATQDHRIVVVNFAKVRNGELGRARLRFTPKTNTWENADTDEVRL